MNSKSGSEAPSILNLLRSAATTPTNLGQARGGPAATRRRPSPAEQRNTGDEPILSPCAQQGGVCVHADTLIDNRFYSVFRSL